MTNTEITKAEDTSRNENKRYWAEAELAVGAIGLLGVALIYLQSQGIDVIQMIQSSRHEQLNDFLNTSIEQQENLTALSGVELILYGALTSDGSRRVWKKHPIIKYWIKAFILRQKL